MSSPMVDAKYYEAAIAASVDILNEIKKKYTNREMWYLNEKVTVLYLEIDDNEVTARILHHKNKNVSYIYLGFLSEQPHES